MIYHILCKPAFIYNKYAITIQEQKAYSDCKTVGLFKHRSK